MSQRDTKFKSDVATNVISATVDCYLFISSVSPDSGPKRAATPLRRRWHTCFDA